MEASGNDHFTDLSDFQQAPQHTARSRGNVIKAASVVRSHAQRVTVEEAGLGQPNIIVHRDGETISQIEVVCTCGKSTTVKFDYGGE